MKTFAEVLGKHAVTVPAPLLSQAEVPVIAGLPQRQGDLLVVPRAPLSAAERAVATLVPADGVQVVRGEATGNTHWLDAYNGPIWWFVKPNGVALGVVDVPEGSIAMLTHTDEHGANGVGPGTYVLHGKREHADVTRRVAD
ncbi:MAG: hypothetical protein ACT4OX_00295 [Actinomycetota bacterium]